MARLVEIEPPVVALLTVLRAGAPIMKLNGKCQYNHVYQLIKTMEQKR